MIANFETSQDNEVMVEFLNQDITVNSLTAELDIVLVAFLMCVINSFVLRAAYNRYGNALSSKVHISNSLPLLSVIVFLVILVVKSSLALSLGLVGALSIVRFRTPIKEPEELVYLFHAIALGLGYGAGQIFVTALISIGIIGIAVIMQRKRSNTELAEYTLTMTVQKQETRLGDLIEVVGKHAGEAALLRSDSVGERQNLVLRVNLMDVETLSSLTEELKSLDKEIDIAFAQHNTNW